MLVSTAYITRRIKKQNDYLINTENMQIYFQKEKFACLIVPKNYIPKAGVRISRTLYGFCSYLASDLKSSRPEIELIIIGSMLLLQFNSSTMKDALGEFPVVNGLLPSSLYNMTGIRVTASQASPLSCYFSD